LTTRVAAAAVALLAILWSAGACGGSGSSQPAGSIKVTMSEFKFDPASISTKSGKVTFFLVNSGSVAHDMVVLGPDGKRLGASDLVQGGNTTVFTIDSLPAGSYQFICDQPGHEQQGMKGTLSVT
jgi:plastocyanin